MRTPNPWLFEAPLVHETTSYASPYTALEYSSHPELGGRGTVAQQQRKLIDASTGPNLLSASQVARAVQQNRQFEQRLWKGLYSPISIYYLRYYTITPDESEFAQAVARWQRAVGLSVDGIIGPNTWKVMRPCGEPAMYRTADGVVRPRGINQVIATFGDPTPTRAPLDQANPNWERANIVHANAPAGLAFQIVVQGGVIQRPFVRGHRLLKRHFERLFHDIAAAGLWNTIQPVSGPYNFRNVRGGRSLSMHAFGIAIDIKPDTFPRGQNRSFPDARIVQIFQDYGFHWGIFFPTPDPMHFQFATGA